MYVGAVKKITDNDLLRGGLVGNNSKIYETHGHIYKTLPRGAKRHQQTLTWKERERSRLTFRATFYYF